MSQAENKLRVLVLDPDGDVEKSVTDVLAETRCDIARAQSDDWQFETFTYRFPFDAVVMNLTTRTGHFLDMIPAIKKLSPEAPIFVVSRLADERMWIRVLGQGADDLFASPPDRAEFLCAFLQAKHFWEQTRRKSCRV